MEVTGSDGAIEELRTLQGETIYLVQLNTNGEVGDDIVF